MSVIFGKKVHSESRKRRISQKAAQSSSLRQSQIQQLQQEIDKLALLVFEAKRQSDRIQAAADALGDAAFHDLRANVVSIAAQDKRERFVRSPRQVEAAPAN